jgi:hypothetical protein
VVQDVTVPDGALGPDFWGTVNALQALGFDDPNRKYLTFADANQFCGIGTLYNDLRLATTTTTGTPRRTPGWTPTAGPPPTRWPRTS